MKGFKDAFLLGGGNADAGVLHPEQYVAVFAPSPDGNLARRRELDCVLYQVKQHVLRQPPLVGQDGIQVFYLHVDLQPFIAGAML